MNKSTASSRYANLLADRQPFLDRARACAVLTLPTLIPPAGHTSASELPTPYQSIGSRGVNNLASRLLMSLLPSNAAFFRLKIDKDTLSDDQQSKAELILSKIERKVMDEIETKSFRVPTFEQLKHLLVAGNVLVYLEPRTSHVRVFRLDRYVVVRDPMGNVLEIITKESVSAAMLSDEVLRQAYPNSPNIEELRKDPTMRSIDLYTHIKRVDDRMVSVQQINNVTIDGTRKSYPLAKSPWIPLRYTRIDGESYGRGFIEEYYGDLRSAEALSKAIVQGSQAAAKILFLVHPNGTTKIKEVQNTPNGGFAYGDPSEIAALQLNKQADFSVAQNMLSNLEQRLSAAFLLGSAVQRSAERVTAEEVRYMAQELETALGGVYSLLAQEMQMPMVNLLLNSLASRGEIPQLPEDVKPQITTGIEALGRGQDLNKLASFLKYLEPLGQDIIGKELNVGDYMDRLAASIGIDTGGLIKSDEQKQQEAAAQQQQARVAQIADMAKPAVAPMAGAMAARMTGQQQ